MNENNRQMDLAALLAKNLAEKETIRRLKRRAKNQAYYLNNKELIKKRSLKNYYLKRGEEKQLPEQIQKAGTEQAIEEYESSGIPVFWILGALAAAWLLSKRKQPIKSNMGK